MPTRFGWFIGIWLVAIGGAVAELLTIPGLYGAVLAFATYGAIAGGAFLVMVRTSP